MEILDEDENFDIDLATRVCWHYYKEGRTQEEIGGFLNLTRKRVNRIIRQALATGLVQITIDSRRSACPELESQLKARYGLRSVKVVPSPMEGMDVRSVVGAAAGQFLSETLGHSESLGVTWGGTIRAAGQNLRRREGGNTVVSLTGGLASSGPVNPYDAAALFARALGAPCRYVTAPMIADSKELRDALLRSAPVAEVLGRVRDIDRALLSAIDLTDQSKALEYGVISRSTWRSLRDAGAVGDIAGQYLDGAGRPVEHPIVERVIAAKLDQLRAIKELVLAAGGAHKAPIIRAGIRAGLVHVLITDEAAATALLDEEKPPQRQRTPAGGR
ncbi:DNA-binding transcriptional regulator LsrR, DeoR family [Enhydrobacter aerosaccus]|uniref:DNA-binding transcriptional regulator LsrR, DeoR family n=1 Tax=Enhydrobacter aerosaccus TaxID=225324 RepID=A0A1T4T1B4_9HYPH|nr:sugar-binding transcriptional regulator [Enhydrobacter aerosaccus]SKA34284.1 DNA-binding transcriptional regulator LsrR, DeoR family [Enhydrobacter aerosaccus]